MSPYEYEHKCAMMVIKRCSRIDAFVVGAIIPIHQLICRDKKDGRFYFFTRYNTFIPFI